MQTNHTTQKKIISHYNNKQLDELYKEISEFIQLTQTCISLSINPTDGRQLMKKCSYYEYTLTNVNKVCADRNYYRKFQNLISTLTTLKSNYNNQITPNNNKDFEGPFKKTNKRKKSSYSDSLTLKQTLENRQKKQQKKKKIT